MTTSNHSNRNSVTTNCSSYCVPNALVSPVDEEAVLTSWTSQDAYARFDRLLNNLQLSPQSSRPPQHLSTNGNAKQQQQHRFKNNLQLSPQTVHGTRLVYANPLPRHVSKSEHKSTTAVCNGATSKRYSTAGCTGESSLNSYSNGVSDATDATLDQLMGEFNFGVSGRKRNWGERNANGAKSMHERELPTTSTAQMPLSHYWPSSNNAEHTCRTDGGGAVASAATAMASIPVDRHSYRWLGDSTVVHHSAKSEDARDVGFWTNVFFNKTGSNGATSMAGGSPTSSRSAGNGHRTSSSSSGAITSQQRKKSTTSILINQILNDNDEQSVGYSRHHDATSHSNRTSNSRDKDNRTTVRENSSPKHTTNVGDSPSSSSSSSSRYNAFNVIKRKNNLLTKTKISPNLNGNGTSTVATNGNQASSSSSATNGGSSSCSSSESERLAKTDLFLLPSANTNGRIYTTLSDGNTSLDGGHFMHAINGLRYDEDLSPTIVRSPDHQQMHHHDDRDRDRSSGTSLKRKERYEIV